LTIYDDISTLFNNSPLINIDTIYEPSNEGYNKLKIHDRNCCVYIDKNDVCAVTYKTALSNENKKVFKNLHDASIHIN
jgi:hypothetical protein